MSATIDLTGIAIATVSGTFSILAIVVPAWLASKMKDKAAAAVVSEAVKNSLGALQQATTSEITAFHPQIAGVPDALAPGVKYVLDQAGPEAARLGITPAAIAQKIEAKVGLANIATNLALTASPAPIVVAPLDPVPTTVVDQGAIGFRPPT